MLWAGAPAHHVRLLRSPPSGGKGDWLSSMGLWALPGGGKPQQCGRNALREVAQSCWRGAKDLVLSPPPESCLTDSVLTSPATNCPVARGPHMQSALSVGRVWSPVCGVEGDVEEGPQGGR